MPGINMTTLDKVGDHCVPVMTLALTMCVSDDAILGTEGDSFSILFRPLRSPVPAWQPPPQGVLSRSLDGTGSREGTNTVRQATVR